MPSTAVHTLIAKGDSDTVQQAIDDNDGVLFVRVPWASALGTEVRSGDGAVIECSTPGCKCCWIADVEDVEGGDGFDLEIMVSVR